MVGLIVRNRARPRSGVSLLEVLFSIGIIAVGLLGVLTIIPFAGSRVTKGTIADAADRLGRNAIRDFELRNMRQPNMWTRFDTSTSTYTNYPPSAFSNSYSGGSFCIDPLFITRQVADAVANGTSVGAATQYFPYYVTTDDRLPRMQRISLRTKPGGGTGIGLDQAKEIFVAQDDLAFEEPTDLTALPLQNWSAANSKRQAAGRLSWMATLTPKEGAASDLYILSIVVFHRRDMSMTMTQTNQTSDNPDNERVATVAEFYSLGYAGGDVRLESTAVNDLMMKAGDWLMLSAKSTAGGPLFRWYRVMAVDTLDGSGPYSRKVTLQGPDWTRSDWFVLNSGMRTSAPSPNYPTQATLVSNVVAVYEKTIRLETSSLWTVQ